MSAASTRQEVVFSGKTVEIRPYIVLKSNRKSDTTSSFVRFLLPVWSEMAVGDLFLPTMRVLRCIVASITVKNREKLQLTDFNEDKTGESTSVAHIATYGCESWTVRKNEETRLEAFEMKGLRKILRVSWTAKKTNE